MKVLVYGNGWLGNLIAKHFDGSVSCHDILDTEVVGHELRDVRPDVVINAAGKCGTPNIDWCEEPPEHSRLTLYSNAYGPVVLYHMVEGVAKHIQRDMFFVHLSSGCLWEWGTNVTEIREPDPPSYYSWTKAEGEKRLPKDRCLILRLRMPLSGKPHPRNLITKVAKYGEVLNTQNSVTVVEDFLPALEKLITKHATGVYNVVNPGAVSPADIMRWYKEIVDQNHTFKVTTVESLKERGIIKAGRSNVTLDTSKLNRMGIELPEVEGRIKECLAIYAQKLKDMQIPG